jgi:preprotein translocase subunit SecD
MGTSMVKGFALTLAIGILVSLFTAITVSRTFLLALGLKSENKIINFLFGTGIK